MSAKKERANELLERLRRAVESVDDQFDRLSLGTINDCISDLLSLRLIMGRCPDIDLALGHFKAMTSLRANKQYEGNRAKDAIRGLAITVANMS
jgi:hypothetical protein